MSSSKRPRTDESDSPTNDDNGLKALQARVEELTALVQRMKAENDAKDEKLAALANDVTNLNDLKLKSRLSRMEVWQANRSDPKMDKVLLQGENVERLNQNVDQVKKDVQTFNTIIGDYDKERGEDYRALKALIKNTELEDRVKRLEEAKLGAAREFTHLKMNNPAAAAKFHTRVDTLKEVPESFEAISAAWARYTAETLNQIPVAPPTIGAQAPKAPLGAYNISAICKQHQTPYPCYACGLI